ncbi:MAG: sigma 54-interacting transcriptional regulator [Acidobacteriia bacterium]|nr:sigma 54-interacting transcriptional regulator [Terriglobia bacterium]
MERVALTPDRSEVSPAEEKLRKLLNGIPAALLLVDREGLIALANAQAERIFGYAPNELAGLAIEVLVPEQFREAHLHHRASYFQTPDLGPMGARLELKGQRKDGTVFPIEVSLSPVEGDSGSVLSVVRDMTGRKRMEQALLVSEERFRRIVAEVKDYAIFMLDPQGRVQTWNEGAQRIKGYGAEGIIGQHLSRFYSAEETERGQPEEALKTAAMAGRVETEGWHIRKDGSRYWANIVITAIHDQDGELLGFTVIERDITEGKRAREAFLLEITNTLLSQLDVSELFSAIASSIRLVKDFDYATLAQYDAETKMFRIQRLDTSTDEDDPPIEVLLPVAGSPAGWAYASGKPLLFKGEPGERLPVEMPPHLLWQSVKSGCWIPLRGREGMLGTLNLFSRRPGAFSADDVGALSQLANQVGIALDNAMAFARISDLNKSLAKEKLILEGDLRTEHTFGEIIGESKALTRVLKQVETVAPIDSTILILGETGTGKELLARAAHDLSPRRERAFVRVDCSSIPAGLLESELFGHEKGAFTGAIAQQIGRFELAHRGTLFLDEVGEIPLELQSKLLRILQDKQFERLGSGRTITVDVRIVAATNRDLSKLVASGHFRSDLFYRLSVFPVVMPPLRERPEDIPILAHHFLSKFASRLKRNIRSIPPESLEALRRYSWPGNVRELEHLIERAVILSPGSTLRIPPFEPVHADQASPAGGATLTEVERDHILRVLRETKGKIGGRGGAAERLGMNRTTLNSRLRKLGISRASL